MATRIQIGLSSVSPTTSEASIRGHKVLVDRPVEKGGSDAGPMGGELFLASVGGCFMSNLLAAIRARSLDFGTVEAQVAGELADGPARFVAVEILVAAAAGDRAELEKLIEIAARGCITVNTLRGHLDISVRAA